MCIAAWVWQAHPVHQLLLLLNRDEFHSRPTKSAGWWGEGSNKILGGRDVLGGGTWMGCTKDGRLAFLTNVLEPDANPGARTRGDLPLRFLQSNKSPLEVATEAIRLSKNFREFLRKLGDDEVEAKDIVERLMTDTTKADKDRLPNTGCDPNWEHGLSSIFIEVQTDHGLYGTRSTAVLSVNYDGEARLYEKYLESGTWKDHTVQYQIE
ncbi:hypothetical protein ABZP36_034596 [Zizania latifolia]